MKVSEAIKELKKLHQNADVYTVFDQDELDENNQFTDLHELEGIDEQTSYIDMGLDFEQRHEVILFFNKKRATCNIYNNN